MRKIIFVLCVVLNIYAVQVNAISAVSSVLIDGNSGSIVRRCYIAYLNKKK